MIVGSGSRGRRVVAIHIHAVVVCTALGRDDVHDAVATKAVDSNLGLDAHGSSIVESLLLHGYVAYADQILLVLVHIK